MNRNAKLLFAFIGGVATGAAIGLLFAPDSGKNTRDKLSFQLNKYFESLSSLLNRSNDDKSPSGQYKELNAEDYKKAESLMQEVEGLLEEIRNKSV
jgi:gas vesicle protein